MAAEGLYILRHCFFSLLLIAVVKVLFVLYVMLLCFIFKGTVVTVEEILKNIYILYNVIIFTNIIRLSYL